jgi:hypothetical protein
MGRKDLRPILVVALDIAAGWEESAWEVSIMPEERNIVVRESSGSSFAWLIGVIVIVAAILLVMFYWHPWTSTSTNSTTVTQPGSGGQSGSSSSSSTTTH